MNGETLLNTYTILVVLVITLLIWLAITWLKKPKGTTKLLSQSQENLTGLGAFMMALCSIGLSIGFSLSLATSIFIGRVAAAIFLLIGGATISIIAGQALIATKVDEAQAKRLQASETYQLALNERQAAQQQVKNLAIDGSIVTQAKQKLAQFENSLAELTTQKDQAIQARNACPPNYLTKCVNPATQAIANLDSKIEVLKSTINKEQAFINQFDRYQSAKSYAENLSSQPLPPSIVNDSTLPGIKALSIVLGIPTEVVGAHVFLFLAVFGELGGIILFYLWGASRLERAFLTIPSGMTLDGEFTSSHSNPSNSSSSSYLKELTGTINRLQQKVTELEHSKKE